MALIVADRVRDTSTSTSTGDFTLSGTAPTTYRTFASVCANGDTLWYAIVHRTANEWEVGIGTSNGATTLTRTTVLAGTSGTSPHNFSAGTKDVFLTFPAGKMPVGKMMIPVPAVAMYGQSTSGAAAGSVQMTTSKNMFKTLDFDSSAQEFAQFALSMPSSWNEGTITFRPIFSHSATTTNFGVVFSLGAVAISNDEPGDVDFGTVQTSTWAGGTTNDIYRGPESAAITVSGTPAAGDYVMFRVARVPDNGSDTMAVDARLHGIELFITTDGGNDS